MTTHKKRNYYLLLIVIFGGFLIFGMSENIKGPALPDIQSDLALSEVMLGILLVINFFAFLLPCSHTTCLISKIGEKLTRVITFVTIVLSGVLLYFSSAFPSLVGAYFILYLGNGM